jgi:hypothetical protein
MTKSRATLLLVAVIAAGYGLASLVGGLFVEGVTASFRITSFVVGFLLVAGAGLLVFERMSGAVLLWLSASTYALVMLVPALQRHGSGAFSALMGAFYLSLAIRVVLAAFAHVLVRRRHG